MAATDTDDEGTGQPAAGSAAGPPTQRRWLIAGAMAATALTLAGAVVAAALLPNPRVVEIEIGGALVYHDFPDIVADLKGDGRRPRYVKLGVIVELPLDLRPRLEEKRMAIVDTLHAYLRERRAEDLVGREGADRVRAALAGMINEALAPDEAKAVLFRQFILN